MQLLGAPQLAIICKYSRFLGVHDGVLHVHEESSCFVQEKARKLYIEFDFIAKLRFQTCDGAKEFLKAYLRLKRDKIRLSKDEKVRFLVAMCMLHTDCCFERSDVDTMEHCGDHTLEICRKRIRPGFRII